MNKELYNNIHTVLEKWLGDRYKPADPAYANNPDYVTATELNSLVLDVMDCFPKSIEEKLDEIYNIVNRIYRFR